MFFPRKHIEQIPSEINWDTDAAYAYVVTQKRVCKEEGLQDALPYQDRQLSGVHIGFSILHRFCNFTPGSVTDRRIRERVRLIAGEPPKETYKYYAIEGLVGATAIELQVLCEAMDQPLSAIYTYWKQIRYPTDDRLLHLKLARHNNFRRTAKTAIDFLRDNTLVHQGIVGNRLDDESSENYFYCARSIGEAVLVAQPMEPASQRARED